jgi:hypothetical protein
MEEMDNFDRKRMGDFYKNNNDFPPSIKKTYHLFIKIYGVLMQMIK